MTNEPVKGGEHTFPDNQTDEIIFKPSEEFKEEAGF